MFLLFWFLSVFAVARVRFAENALVVPPGRLLQPSLVGLGRLHSTLLFLEPPVLVCARCSTYGSSGCNRFSH